MADVTLAVRARKWLEDPATEVDDVDRAFLNALLAIATAQRETATEIRFLSNRIEQIVDETIGLCAPDAKDLAIKVRKGEREMARR